MDLSAPTEAPPLATAADGTQSGVRAKGLGPRAGAVLIDGLVLAVLDLFSTLVSCLAVTFTVGTALAWMGHGFFRAAGDPRPTAVALAGTMPLVYFMLFEWVCGATPGKVLLDMRVVRADGRPCDLRAAAVRGLLRYVDALLLGPALWLLMRRPPHRRLGDRAGGTVVVDDRSPLLRRPDPPGGPGPRRRLWAALAAYFAIACFVNGAVFAVTLRVR